MKRILFSAMLLASLPMQSAAISLEECYTLARNNYPLVRQYELTEAMSRYSFENAAMGYVPQISIGAQATLQSDVTEFPGAFDRLLAAAGVEMTGLSHDQYKVQLDIRQTIWDGGYSKAQREAVKAQAEVSRLTLDKDIDALKTRINQMYFGILVMEENIRTSLYMDTLMTSNMKVVESAVRNGTALASDIDNIRVELLTLRQERSQLESAVRTYKDMLAIMIGRRIEDSEEFETPEAVLVDTSLNQRTELLLFDARIREIQQQKRMLDVAVMPKFALFAQGWYGKPGLNIFDDMVYNRMSWNGIAGITFQWDISAFCTRKNDLRNISLSQRSIELQRDVFQWNTSLQQTQIQNEIERMYEMKASDDEIVRLRESVRKVSESKYRNGVITVNELLRDIMNENRAKTGRSRHELELLKNIYDLKIMLNQ
ncbi:MAG: TolC family protein [Bacteroidetes bacterium]|uniref:TolC family protein n=1 Tax=Candidatus Cryptobacteroides excrementavium TaxID=2840759 RepID=A0A9D9J2Q8_9BACT|nr:TolC family protein [Candidatus Cryptobacteroides excrementavium]